MSERPIIFNDEKESEIKNMGMPTTKREIIMKQPYRHGDVLIIPRESIPATATKRDDLVLAEGEATGHAHRISEGAATLFEFEDGVYLKVQDELATLTHEEHKALELPRGDYEIKIQREYDDEKEWRKVLD